MANISQLSMTFVDGSTVINADKMNGIVSKINEMVTAINNGSTPVQQTVATPVINISGNTATITCATSGATIKYTIDGSTPSASNGSTYSSAITLNASCTIKAVAIKSGMTNSSVASQSYTPSVVATPVIKISGTSATITCSTSGATIHYTLDGTTPTASSTQYSSPITLSAACTIKAIAVKNGVQSSVASAIYAPGTSADLTSQFNFNDNAISHFDGQLYEIDGLVGSDYVDVSEFVGKPLKYSRIARTAESGTIGIAFYDSNHNYISGKNGIYGAAESTMQLDAVIVPDNAKYIRCTAIEGQTASFVCVAVWSAVNITSSVSQFTNLTAIDARNGQTASSTIFKASSPFNVTAGTILVFTEPVRTTSSHYGLAFYNSNNDFVSGIMHPSGSGLANGYDLGAGVVPANAVTARLTWYNGTGSGAEWENMLEVKQYYAQ